MRSFGMVHAWLFAFHAFSSLVWPLGCSLKQFGFHSMAEGVLSMLGLTSACRACEGETEELPVAKVLSPWVGASREILGHKFEKLGCSVCRKYEGTIL